MLRAITIWAGLKLIVTGGGAALQASVTEQPITFTDALPLAPPAAVALVGLVAGLALLDSKRRNEILFLANVGVPFSTLAFLAALPPAVIELLLILL